MCINRGNLTLVKLQGGVILFQVGGVGLTLTAADRVIICKLSFF